MKKPLIVILGPTSTGKTSLGLLLSKKFSGEIVSADSRQIYKYMDIGTGKIPLSEEREIYKGNGYWIVDGVYIRCFDLEYPSRRFTVVDFARRAKEEIESIWRRGKVPFVVGGTGFYIDILLGRVKVSGVPQNESIRKKAENMSIGDLSNWLLELDRERHKLVDRNNRARVIRAIEVAIGDRRSGGVNPYTVSVSGTNPLYIGLTGRRGALYKKADKWAEGIFEKGILKEVEHLINLGYGRSFPLKGLVYNEVISILGGKRALDEAKKRIKFDLHAYIRRQLTYFNRNCEVLWHNIGDKDIDVKVEKLVKSYLDE